MKRIYRHATFTAFFALTMMFLSASAARAQHGYRVEKPLKFAAGKSSATVKGRIAHEQEAHEYKFKAKQGQVLHITLSAPNKEIMFVVQNAEYDAVDGFTLTGERDQSSELPASGDYIINVSANRGKGGYTLFVEVKNK